MTTTARAQGATVWLTELPSAGKTAVARLLGDRLKAEGRRVEVLDGDEVRRFLSTGLGFSREDRNTDVPVEVCSERDVRVSTPGRPRVG